MFKLKDGRHELWQWDVNNILTVADKSITEVHFYRDVIDNSIVLKVENGEVLIPDEILQSSGILKVYAMTDKHTMVEKQFRINKKVKPADYVYTPTELKLWENKLDKSGWTPNRVLGTDSKGNVVPVIGGGGGGSGSGAVDSVNGQVGVVTLTADDIAFDDGQTFQEKLNQGSLKGDKGEPGEQGIDGKPGAKGDTGESGVYCGTEAPINPEIKVWLNPNGTADKVATEQYVDDAIAAVEMKPGIKGDKGDKGEPGKDGLPGAKGDKGEPGTPGKDGKDGLPGIQGIPGEPGKDGKDGLPGAPGEKGADGLPGKDGVDGQPGAAGKDATINGVNALTIEQGENITLTQSDGTLTISAKASGGGGASSGVGKNVEGQEFSYKENYATKTGIAQVGAEIFNDYSKAGAIGKYSHAEGSSTAVGDYSHAEGGGESYGREVPNYAIGTCSHAEGQNTQAIGEYSHAEGYQGKTRVDAIAAHVEGNVCIAEGRYSHAEGNSTKAIGTASHAEGESCEAQGDYSHAEGGVVIAGSSNQHAQGKYNINDTANTYADIVGNGTGWSEKANAYTLDWKGNGAFLGKVSSTGADYAEYFEWVDGNKNSNDRVGYIVSLEGDKIKFANESDDVLGIISGTVGVLGDNYEWQWQGKYQTDEFGRVIYDMVEEFHTDIDKDGNEVKHSLGFFPQPRIVSTFDANKEYVNRANRPEWDAVGMMGKLFVRDDGTAQVGGYVKPVNGVATASETKTRMRVMSRVTDNVVRVCLL